MNLSHIKRFVGPEIYRRGLSYYRDSHVKSFLVADRTLSARVQGQYYQEYKVTIELSEKGIRKATCTCPYYALCKHIAAVLIYYVKKELAHEGRMENPFKNAPRETKTKIIPLTLTPGARDASEAIFRTIDPARFLAPQNPSGQRWKLCFLISVSFTPFSSSAHDRWVIEPALLYLRQNNTTGRIAAFKPELVTEKPADLEMSLLSRFLDLADQRDSLSRFIGPLLKNPTLCIYIRRKAGSARLVFTEITAMTLSFKLSHIHDQQVFFTPRLSVMTKDGSDRKLDHRTDELYTDATTLVVFPANESLALYYQGDTLTLALIERIMAENQRLTAFDIETLRRFVAEKDISFIHIQFTAREVRLVRMIPAGVIEIEETPPLNLLSLTLFFKYGQTEVSRREKLRFVLLEDGESLDVALRNEDLEEKLEHYVWQILQEAHKASLSIDSGYVIQIRKINAHDLLEQFAQRLFDEGFEIRLKQHKQRIVPVRGRMRVVTGSGVDWFNLKVEYTDEVGAKIDIRFDAELISQGLVKSHDQYIYLSKDDIQKLERLLAEGMDAQGNLATSKLNLSLIDELKDRLSDPEDPDIKHARKIYENLTRFDTISEASLPASLKASLRGYQHKGYSWLRFLYDYGLGGCLADDMGLGKTVQTLALLAALKENGILGTSLLVVPLTTVANWENEIRRFAPSLTFMRHLGVKRKKDMDLHYNFDLVITTYHTLRNDAEYFSNVPFDFMILDESQNIKNARSQVFRAVKKCRARHRLALTGTPVENNTLELWAQMEFLNPGLLGSAGDFIRRFARPIEAERDRERAELLKKRIYPFILRRKKEDVLEELPAKEEISVYVEMGERQKALYERLRAESLSRMKRVIQEGGLKRAGIDFFQALLRLRQCALIPGLVHERFTATESAKLDMLYEMIDEISAEGHKLLVFSQFVACLKVIEKHLKKKNLEYSYLDGSTQHREEEIARFQTDDQIGIFLLSLKAGGVGVNLTAADYVILFDPWWNPAVEAQAIDRTHRIGQMKKVTVYRLLAQDTVEQRIQELQEKKKQLVADLVSADSPFYKSLTKEDVLAIFT